ncbi:hypothetical protein [Paenibacillus apiarius]|uniref:Uncharacterized protein n=1 Tax=Paenibacillus apiarius TaxID=46240 RepID=A0ABT4DQY1_9BACL|nr:hypothetical protein [Paenibacillus apiarius]MBN3526847.1 hypothetical protein [Paenibacillus apiarius]MCY9513357.1 hypothetical protein [Paenibacillus apiarius]MCY9519671.1 hypothetical protein [Paenibacillus apiarius]MCY9553273.1 hypothetical protein [Paenibacillus apiarius]MCY9557123.1 hypothetical protein [Paenibacillus apiarius]
MWATNAAWVWALCYTILGISLAASVYSLFRKLLTLMSWIHVGVLITGFAVFFLNSLGRSEGMTELEYLVNQLFQGSSWAIFVVCGYLYTIVWWCCFISSYRRN